MIFDDDPAWLIEAVKTATDLRDEAKVGGFPSEGPADLHETLLKHRKALDALEEIVARTGRLKARADMVVREKQNVLEDAEVHAETLKSEYSTALEKNSHIKAQTVDQRIAWRKAVRQRDQVADAHEYVKTLYRGLDGSRRDLDTRIRLITLQTSLEK